MLCRACNTRYSDDERTCPNCGRVSTNPGLSGGGAAAKPPSQLGPSSAQPVEVELDQKVERKAKPPAKKAAAAPAEHTAPALTPSHLRELVAREPGLIEKGLRVGTDKGDRSSGVAYATDVGEIDLLALDDAGGLVVVLVADGQKGSDLVAEALQRIGWVRKHVAKPGQEVRGLVLAESRPADLGYVAAAVAGTVGFKTWRMSITLDDVEL